MASEHEGLAADLKEHAEIHRSGEYNYDRTGGEFFRCLGCSERWPCLPERIVQALQAATDRAEQAGAALAYQTTQTDLRHQGYLDMSAQAEAAEASLAVLVQRIGERRREAVEAMLHTTDSGSRIADYAIKNAMDALLANLPDRTRQAQAERQALREALSLAVSMIRSGEPMTEQAEEVFRKVRE